MLLERPTKDPSAATSRVGAIRQITDNHMKDEAAQVSKGLVRLRFRFFSPEVRAAESARKLSFGTA